jgi:Flp pilus assembly protein TadG
MPLRPPRRRSPSRHAPLAAAAPALALAPASTAVSGRRDDTRRPRPARDPAGGVAALELAMVLPMLALLLLGMFDYGKYMWVSIAATQAAREGARELSQIPVGNCATNAKVGPAITLEQGNSGAARLYMNEVGLMSATTVTVSCQTLPIDPTWKIALKVDFPPMIGYMTTRGLMPKGSGTTARVQTQLIMRGY